MGDTWRQQPVIYLFCLLSGQLTAPVRTQPVIYQALVAALSGILKTSLLTVNPSLGVYYVFRSVARGQLGAIRCTKP